jgi:anti-sigma B factor antagonist
MRDRATAETEVEFRIEEEHPLDGVVLLALRGEADLHVAGELRDRLSIAVDGGATAIVLDMTEVTFVDSMTLGVLVACAKRVRALGGELRLVVTGAPIRRILEVTLLDRLFPLDDTREEALAAAAS